ncbi:hypothetical protein B0H14DRAFT_3467562 [Mycena olivaceomarginata]|nr:hypothetical protein B0H14DRAFT_3467562 [Mycena olivaceomarginata]
MAAFKRSRSNLTPEPDFASSSNSVPLSVKSTSTTANSASMRSGQSHSSRANPKSLDETQLEIQRKRSRVGATSAAEEPAEDLTASISIPGGLPPAAKKHTKSRSSNCVVQ